MAKSVRIYVDFSAIEKALKEADSDAILDVASVSVYEGSSKGGTFDLIDTIPYNPHVKYIETEKAVEKTHWFKIAYADAQGVLSDLSEPTLAEDIYDLIDKVAVALGDVNRLNEDEMAFTDDEYTRKIRSGTKRLKSSPKLDLLTEEDLEIVILLVRGSCCYDLAYDNARYTKLDLPDGISLDKGERVKHYLDIAKSIEAYFQSIMEDGTSESGTIEGTPSIEVGEIKVQSYFSSVRLPQRRQYRFAKRFGEGGVDEAL